MLINTPTKFHRVFIYENLIENETTWMTINQYSNESWMKSVIRYGECNKIISKCRKFNEMYPDLQLMNGRKFV